MEQMLICLSLALIAGLLMSRAAKAVRLPAVTAYLLTGLLLGPFFLGRLGLSRFGFGFASLAAVEGYGIITQVALGFIAFVIGTEHFKVGERCAIWGRIQSREYMKKLDEENVEKRVAFEVSVSKLELLEEARESIV